MPRPTVLAEQFAGSQVGAALREHREDRDALLSSLTASLEADPRVLAFWLWGSFQNGEADDLSDLDPWVIVTDEAALEMGASLQYYARRTGNFISGGEAPHNAPPQGGYFASRHEGRHGLLHVDCYGIAISTCPPADARNNSSSCFSVVSIAARSRMLCWACSGSSEARTRLSEAGNLAA